jgi:hypothetical protein
MDILILAINLRDQRMNNIRECVKKIASECFCDPAAAGIMRADKCYLLFCQINHQRIGASAGSLHFAHCFFVFIGAR